MRALAAQRSHQTALGKFLKLGKERALPLDEDVEIDGALVEYSKNCVAQGILHHHGSRRVAAVIDRWPSFSRFGSRSCRGIILMWQCSPHSATGEYAPVRVAGIEKEGYCSTACATSPMLVGRDRSFRNWIVYQDRGPRCVGPHGSALASMGQEALSPAQVEESCGANL